MKSGCFFRKVSKYGFLGLVFAFAALVLSCQPVPAKPEKAQENFSLLRITEISIRGSKLHIRGETDLPKGSSLHLILDSGAGIFDADNHGKKVKIHVNSHFFFVQVDLPKGREKGNLFRIRLRFDPSGQQERIRKIVGLKGENLKGRLVVEEEARRMLQLEKFLLF
ncbi:MAG: hypothetical protein ACP5CD_00930 [Thermovirgaceae bacterium]